MGGGEGKRGWGGWGKRGKRGGGGIFSPRHDTDRKLAYCKECQIISLQMHKAGGTIRFSEPIVLVMTENVKAHSFSSGGYLQGLQNR